MEKGLIRELSMYAAIYGDFVMDVSESNIRVYNDGIPFIDNSFRVAENILRKVNNKYIAVNINDATSDVLKELLDPINLN